MNKSFYFQHDYNAANDYKILFLRQQLGIEGYGIYWYVLEQLAQSGGKMPLKIIPVMAMQIQTTPDKVNSVIKNYDLFTIDEELFFSIRLLKTISWRNDLSENGKKGAAKKWQNKALNGGANGHPNGGANGKGDKGDKGKERKEDKIYIQVAGELIFDPMTVLKIFMIQLNGMVREQNNIAWEPLVPKWFEAHAGEDFKDEQHAKNSFKKFYMGNAKKSVPKANKFVA